MNSAIHEPKPPTPISTALAPRSAGLNAASWALALVAAGILGMTLPFKFTGAEETVRLFETLGAGTPGRLGTALLETLAVGLLLVPRTRALGGTLTVGLMAGALLGHAFVLGILWDGDATLFSMAVTAFLAGAGVAWIHRREQPIVGERFAAA